jgi:hypothetical protein
MCDCIERITENVKRQHNIRRVHIEKMGWCEICYTPIRRDGEDSKHNSYESVDWKFCPFCGEKILPKYSGGK